MKMIPPHLSFPRAAGLLTVGAVLTALATLPGFAQDNSTETTVAADNTTQTTVTSGGFGGSGGTGGAASAGFGGGGDVTTFHTSRPGEAQMIIRAVAAEDAPQKDSPWLGVAVEETTEPLAAQLGLRRGEGLVVSIVSSNSPAALAGLQKNDVIVQLDGQMLVDPAQLRKLVQMHAPGEAVKIGYFRAGKKESATAKLAAMPADEAFSDGTADPFRRYYQRFNNYTAAKPVDERRIKIQVEQAMADAQRAMKEALVQSQNQVGSMNQRLQMLQQKLGNYAKGGVNLEKNSTVIVKNETDSVRTVVKKDESGTYILVADPTRHLTVHDADNKLLFDGIIDTPEQRKKVPANILKKVDPMLEQLDSAAAPDATSEAPEPPEPPAAPAAPAAPSAPPEPSDS